MLTIVVPTRNRPDLVARSIASIADRQEASVIVSENSGPGPAREAVENICRSEGIRMIAPETTLRMVDHWEWAITEALEHSAATHVTFLTDRMVYRPHAIEYLRQAIESFPEKVICYNHDRINDAEAHIRLQLQPSTFQAFRTDPRAILSLCAQARPDQWVLPRMLNSVVPVEHVRHLKARAGHVFGGISPDYYFAYQLLSHIDAYISLDLPLLVHHALGRSNGHSFSTGIISPATKEFMAFEGELRFDTPFPDIITITNAELHDYVVVARETESPLFPPLDVGLLYARLGREIEEMEAGPFREEMTRRFRNYSPPVEAVQIETLTHRRRSLTALLYQMTVPRIPVERVPGPLRLPLIALGGYYEHPLAALEAALTLSVRSDPADPARWPSGSEPCASSDRFEPWVRGGHALRV